MITGSVTVMLFTYKLVDSFDKYSKIKEYVKEIKYENRCGARKKGT